VIATVPNAERPESLQAKHRLAGGDLPARHHPQPVGRTGDCRDPGGVRDLRSSPSICPCTALPASSPFNIENSPFRPGQRTSARFAVDYVNNSTGAAGGGWQVADPSGTHFINLSSLLTSRDNVRQGVADLFVLAKTIPSIDFDGNGADFDGSRIAFTGQSLGSIVGTQFVALEPTVNQAVLSVPGGGIARLLEASPTFGPRIRAGLAASAGLQPGTANVRQLLRRDSAGHRFG
jgi:hypothetical protein